MEKAKERERKPYYSAVLKRQVVREYESGHYSKESLSIKYGLLGSNTVLAWWKKYGILAASEIAVKKQEVKEKKKKVVKGETAPPKLRRSTEQERISELEKQLSISRQREQLYLRVIEITSEETGEDLLKKTGIGLWNQSAEKVS